VRLPMLVILMRLERQWDELTIKNTICRLATGPWLLISLLCGKVIVGLVVACSSSITTSEGVDIPSPGWFA
jgi:hypothetical protein